MGYYSTKEHWYISVTECGALSLDFFFPEINLPKDGELPEKRVPLVGEIAGQHPTNVVPSGQLFPLVRRLLDSMYLANVFLGICWRPPATLFLGYGICWMLQTCAFWTAWQI